MSNGRQRSTGVTMITAYYALGSVTLAILALTVVAGARVLGGLPILGFGAFAYGMGGLLALLAGVNAAVTYGIWTMSEWGWIAGMVTSGAYALAHLFGTLSGFGFSLATFAISVAIVWYLHRERDRFRRTSDGDTAIPM